MDLRLDPRLPLVWRDPQTLQIGVDRPRVLVPELSSRHERIVSAVAAGHGRGGVAVLARHVGSDAREVEAVIERIAPALVTGRSVAVPVVEVAGSSELALEVAGVLAELGLDVRRVTADHGDGPELPDLGVAVADHVHDPVVSASWLRRDIPHLHVVLGDSLCRVGPVVVPGETACAHCLDLFRAEVDEGWGVIAAQLSGRPAAPAGPVIAREIAARVARRVVSRLDGSEWSQAVRPMRSGTGPAPQASDRTVEWLSSAGADPAVPSVRPLTRPGDAVLEMVSLDTGDVTRSTSRPHPSCGCVALPENGSVDVRSSPGSGPAAPTRGSAVVALA